MKNCDNCGEETDYTYSYRNMLICNECKLKLEEHYTKIIKDIGRVIPPEKHRERYEGNSEDGK